MQRLWSCLIAKPDSESRILFFPLEAFDNFVLPRTIKPEAFPSKNHVVLMLLTRNYCLYAVFNYCTVELIIMMSGCSNLCDSLSSLSSNLVVKLLASSL